MSASWILLALAGVSAAAILNARWPRRSLPLIAGSWMFGWALTELAPHALLTGAVVATLAVAAGGLDHPAGIVGLVVWLICVGVAVPLALSAVRVKIEIEGHREELDVSGAPRVPRLHLLIPMLGLFRPGVRRERGRVYARLGRRKLKLDIYRARSGAAGEGPKPAVINVHGGAWISGSRHEQGRPLLNHLAANGWVGFNIDYRLSPWVKLPEQVADVKRSIAWIREHAQELGVDPDFIALTGGSAGGHLCALAALTPGDEFFQPGFEPADTSVQAAVPFYGIYDFIDGREEYPRVLEWLVRKVIIRADPDEEPELYRQLSPVHNISATAPPFLLVHGTADTLVPVSEFRRFVGLLRRGSQEPVLSIEMPGAQHAFDVLPSWRTLPVIEAIERFLRLTYDRAGAATTVTQDELESSLTASKS